MHMVTIVTLYLEHVPFTVAGIAIAAAVVAIASLVLGLDLLAAVAVAAGALPLLALLPVGLPLARCVVVNPPPCPSEERRRPISSSTDRVFRSGRVLMEHAICA